jgi:hypothetical protein
MKKTLLLAAFIFLIAATALAAFQPFTTTATITVQRRSQTTQNDADEKLRRDIERYVRAYYSNVTDPTPKDGGGVCTAFSANKQKADGTAQTVNLELYNRDATTCAVLIQGQGKTDLRNLTALQGVLERAFRLQFDEITDSLVVNDGRAAAEAAAKAELINRVAEKP